MRFPFVRSLEEDLKRRDFTVNAFALDETGEIIDLFHGLEDLENQVLRAVGVASERFNEVLCGLCVVSVFKPVLASNLSQKHLKL